jgi:hypothetical protein
MTRFNEIKINSTCGTVEVGAGLTWDQVYAALEPTGVNVVGGRIPGVGVAGLSLGGGESLFIDRERPHMVFQAIHIRQVSMDLRLTTLLDLNLYFQTGQSQM